MRLPRRKQRLSDVVAHGADAFILSGQRQPAVGRYWRFIGTFPRFSLRYPDEFFSILLKICHGE
ncbi:hypothetical protein BL250_11465 [Erwinia sp. OLTSP20]|nr:hypothetical protein BV501_10880 [Erwinia sp. OAMSP11]PIJ71437.1 hypothetical protein BK416_11585 [Erwinia sp. OLSSP12]PIJ80872.1 hypothetical protein BLD47_10480 [Erwinia sp. OLCASP19]PIJ83351.1 hypothetical protein BLD46_09875 [Erwinia sp. OLMTSP26]PIJ85573.1 hypothetical protein BLD49_10425 [Erwinia sp. OLMDSP33]PIJ89624.1 hypothetical protein BL249_15750 [Erwinia sp. OLFS4]PIJ92099.1 hypothetical protein BL250_11465 [Erwinia sp. OLTSP20]